MSYPRDHDLGFFQSASITRLADSFAWAGFFVFGYGMDIPRLHDNIYEAVKDENGGGPYATSARLYY